jgi:hypothetical protein
MQMIIKGFQLGIFPIDQVLDLLAVRGRRRPYGIGQPAGQQCANDQNRAGQTTAPKTVGHIAPTSIRPSRLDSSFFLCAKLVDPHLSPSAPSPSHALFGDGSRSGGTRFPNVGAADRLAPMSQPSLPWALILTTTLLLSTRGDSPQFTAAKSVDADLERFWTTDEWQSAAEITYQLNARQRFNVAMLQVQISQGQRINAVALDTWSDGQWRELARATTVGYKRLLRFAPVEADRVRVRILDSRVCPTLSNFGLFLEDR